MTAPLKLEDLIKAHYFEFMEAALSPDDQELIVVFGNSDMLHSSYGIDERNRSIWKTSLADGSTTQLVGPGEDGRAPAWSPDGKTIAYVARVEDKNEIWVMSFDGSNKHKVTDSHFPARNPFDKTTLRWSPDGKGLAYSLVPEGGMYSYMIGKMAESQDLNKAPRMTVEGANSKAVAPSAIFPTFETAIYLLDPVTSKLEMVTNERGSPFEVSSPFELIDWLPGGHHLLAGFGKELLQINVETGDRASLYSGPRSFAAVRDDVIWIANLAGSKLELGCIEKGEFKAKASADVPGYDVRIRGLSRSGDLLFGTLRQGISTQLFALDRATSSFEFITQVGATADEPITCSTRESAVYYQYSAPAQPQELWSWEKGGPSQQVTKINDYIDVKSLGDVRVFSYPSHGWDIESVLILPKDFEQNGTCPTLVYAHGGPDVFVSGASFQELISARAQSAAHWMAAHGYAVFLPNFRGTRGYGSDFEYEISDYRLTSSPYEDVMAGLDYLIDEKVCDPDALGIYGSSGGGWLSAWAITQTNRFKGAVACLGLYDMLHEDRMGFGGRRTFMSLKPNRLGKSDPSDVWLNPSVYEKISPIDHVPKAKTPLLMIETQADLLSNGSRAKPFFNGLAESGVETFYAYYRDAFHNGGWNDDYKRDYLKRLLAWFDHCIKGDELPDWFPTSTVGADS